MTIKVDIQNLLKRMNDDTNDSNPSKTTSFIANREAFTFVIRGEDLDIDEITENIRLNLQK